MSVTQSPSFWDRTSKFLVAHKSAIVVTAAVGASAAAGAYFYLNNPEATESSPSSKKKKKSKKKKRDDDVQTSSSSLESLVAGAIFPTDPETFLPKIDDELVSGSSAEQKDEYASALKETGNALFKEKSYENAIEFYTAALKFKEDPVFYSNRSACWASLENHEKVIEDTTKAIALKPDYTKCLLRRSQSYDILERYEDAMFDLTAVTIYGGFNNRSTDAQLEKILQKQSVKIVEQKLLEHSPSLPSTSSISPFFGAFKPETGLSDLDVENLEADSGAKFLIEALEKMSLNTTEGYEAADVLIKQAADRYGKELSPKSPEARHAAIAFEYLGAFDFLKNNSDLAINNIIYSIALAPRPRAYIMLGLIYADRQEMENATKQFEFARSLDPEDADIYYHLGQLLYLSNDLKEAEKKFLKAKELNPNNLYAYIQLACIAYREGKLEEADEKFAEARKKFPTAPEVPNYYGEILSDKQEFEKAIKQFDMAARLQAALPTFTIGAVALVNKATLVSREDIKKAETILQEAVEVDPKSEIAKMSLAQVKLQLEEPKVAVELFEEASRLARGYTEKLQATQFAEAAKMQVRMRNDPVLSVKLTQLMTEAAAAGAFAQ